MKSALTQHSPQSSRHLFALREKDLALPFDAAACRHERPDDERALRASLCQEQAEPVSDDHVQVDSAID